MTYGHTEVLVVSSAQINNSLPFDFIGGIKGIQDMKYDSQFEMIRIY